MPDDDLHTKTMKESPRSELLRYQVRHAMRADGMDLGTNNSLSIVAAADAENVVPAPLVCCLGLGGGVVIERITYPRMDFLDKGSMRRLYCLFAGHDGGSNRMVLNRCGQHSGASWRSQRPRHARLPLRSSRARMAAPTASAIRPEIPAKPPHPATRLSSDRGSSSLISAEYAR